jgi:2-methylisocitrate lyase-like PEP mutase family enzyme
MPRPSTADKCRAFRQLHANGCFVIPNPWNAGTARYLQSLGFKALATTSSGYAHAQGYADGEVTRDMILGHCRELAAVADVPVNADFEAGYASNAAGVADNVRLCVETGVAGLSIEDATGDDKKPLYDFDTALERVRAARAAIDKAGSEVIFTARSASRLRRWSRRSRPSRSTC